MKDRYSHDIQNLIALLAGKWVALIVHTIQDTTLRFSEIQKALPDTKQKVLTETLKRLERNGIIVRTPYPTVPPQVEYKLTSIGLELLPVTQVMMDWSEKYADEIKQAQKAYDGHER